jgi:hypothetical protein
MYPRWEEEREGGRKEEIKKERWAWHGGHVSNPSTREAKEGGSQVLRSSWSTQ